MAMKIEKFLPSAALRPFVREFLLIESDEERGNTILPDTALVMAFRYKGMVHRLEDSVPADGRSNDGRPGEIKTGSANRIMLPVSVITGLRKSSRLVYYSKDTGNLLVVLKEGGITAFSGVPANELFGLSIPTDNLLHPAQLRGILQRLEEATDNRQRIDSIEAFLLQQLTGIKPDPLIGHAVQFIKQHNGILRIKDLAASLHISQDPLEKRFRAAIGSTPKQYASIIRLRSLIQKFPSYSSLTDASYEAGYFDQSHFIKDFRLFTGQTPKDFFRSARYW